MTLPLAATTPIFPDCSIEEQGDYENTIENEWLKHQPILSVEKQEALDSISMACNGNVSTENNW